MVYKEGPPSEAYEPLKLHADFFGHHSLVPHDYWDDI
jgi:hypothetical protein